MPTTETPTAFFRPGDVAVPLASQLNLRWSPVRFDRRRGIDPGDLVAVLEAARWAPSTFGEEPWRFVVARRGDEGRPEVEAALADQNAWARDAAVLVVGISKTTFTRNGAPNGMAAHDLGISLGGLLAEATARGLATHPMGGFRRDALRAALQVPDDFDLHWVLALGHYDPAGSDPTLEAKDGRPRGRRPLSGTVFGGRFGVPAAL